MKTQIRYSVVWTLLLLCSAGCGSSKPVSLAPVDPDALPSVQCTVQFSGQKISDAIVMLRGKEKGSPKILSLYDNDADCYKFYTMEGKQKKWGVPVGEYDVSVKPVAGSKTKIPAKYGDPKTSGLTAEIHAGTNSFPFELTP